jgi:3-deoxy-D-manno-octulosonic-acid transferase
MLTLYKIITIILYPFILLYLIFRKNKGKEDAVRFKERLGHSGFARPQGALVWIHAASVGEAVSILPLITEITKRYENLHILLTTGTVTSAKLMETRLPDRAFHQYAPIDSYLSVRRFLKHWQPDFSIWVESEFWPNLLTETRKTCPIVLINARVSNNSFKKWQRNKDIARAMMRSFSLSLPQSKEDMERLQELGANNVKYIGNLKFDSPSLPASSKEMGVMLNMIGERHVWLTASTHPGEEEMIADIHTSLKENNPDLLTIIVPRHAKRGKEVNNIISSAKLKVAMRSANEIITEKTDVYIADTMGELGIFYRLASIVLMGGSLVNHGGQNPLEPARLECAIVLGPFMDNFLEIVAEFNEQKACIQARNKNDVIKIVDELLHDHERQETLAKAALKIVNEKSGLLNVAIKELKPFIEASTTKY